MGSALVAGRDGAYTGRRQSICHLEGIVTAETNAPRRTQDEHGRALYIRKVNKSVGPVVSGVEQHDEQPERQTYRI